MIRRLPVIPTLIVLVAVAIMVRLGFWQLDRLHEKEAMQEKFAAAQSSSGSLGNLAILAPQIDPSYRLVSVDCAKVAGWRAVAGTNARGDAGIAHIANCEFGRMVGAPHGSIQRSVEVTIGWSKSPASPQWSGGHVEGTALLGANGKMRVVADPPLAGLEANARPDPKNIPNNHLSYAVQWFLFAAIALVIYGLALRKRLAAKGERG